MAFKRRIFFRFAALLLCLALLVPSVPAAAANIYFTSLNDQVLPLTADTMPVVSGGVMYVPASVFDGIPPGSIWASITATAAPAIPSPCLT